jgi:hypothetical protein
MNSDNQPQRMHCIFCVRPAKTTRLPYFYRFFTDSYRLFCHVRDVHQERKP